VNLPLRPKDHCRYDVVSLGEVIALWDLLGKISNQPVYRLLGVTKSRVRTYFAPSLDVIRAKRARPASTSSSKPSRGCCSNDDHQCADPLIP
jgi:hypothetical protein